VRWLAFIRLPCSVSTSTLPPFFACYDIASPPSLLLAPRPIAYFVSVPPYFIPRFLPQVRFSTVIHERGSPETLRDPRGFAVKFYTREGNFDMVGNNIPVSLD
jgi:hypothetical protein